jgi:hypothetical protein
MSEAKSRQKPAAVSAAPNITVLNPACTNALVPRVPLAPRNHPRLEGKTLYLVDIGWGGPAAAYSVFQVMQDWFAREMPQVKTVLARKKGSFMEDDPDLWNEIKAKGDGCIIGISC